MRLNRNMARRLVGPLCGKNDRFLEEATHCPRYRMTSRIWCRIHLGSVVCRENILAERGRTGWSKVLKFPAGRFPIVPGEGSNAC
jgi:hypothetical protein